MKTRALIVICSLLTFMGVSGGAFAASDIELEHASVNIRDTAATQRGAKLFVNYCQSCHSASYMRYNRLAEDLGLGEDLVIEHLMFTDAKIGDTMEVSMRPDDAESWLGKAPPDLSLIARSRGADWLYTYFLSFYRDESGGWNNLVLPNASMPHVFWQLQGIQEPVMGEHDGHAAIEQLELAEPGLQSPAEYEETIRDLVTFLEYLGEPAEVKRRGVGVWVLLFLVLFALTAYALKAEYWRDVH